MIIKSVPFFVNFLFLRGAVGGTPEDRTISGNFKVPTAGPTKRGLTWRMPTANPLPCHLYIRVNLHIPGTQNDPCDWKRPCFGGSKKVPGIYAIYIYKHISYNMYVTVQRKKHAPPWIEKNIIDSQMPLYKISFKREFSMLVPRRCFFAIDSVKQQSQDLLTHRTGSLNGKVQAIIFGSSSEGLKKKNKHQKQTSAKSENTKFKSNFAIFL